ncbi:DUF6364 family protein [Desulfitibacter alkalitolerans]|uniref:DUF6364 family protein n=1 Tax=Desulfitibacter alkalitolerans TaxID=264641 RepID=UPI000480198C|nr:DUF6364 family protein [Desulfitibacter alkalitolerans]
MKNITFNIDEDVIEKARAKAQMNKTTLNSLVKEWLSDYIKNTNISRELDSFMSKTNYVEAGRSFSRDEYNER